MYRIFATAVALTALGACGDGNPFSTGVNGGTTGDEDEIVSDGTIPEQVAGQLTGISYNPDTETLSLTGLQRDGDEVTVEYERRAALDQGVYEAYTFQDDPLDEHTTVYVRNLGNVTGATAVTGGQFTYFTGGATYARTGGYDPIQGNQDSDQGLVTYAGEYIGLSDLNGPDTDLLPVPAVDVSVTPAQASVVNGRIFINVEFDTGEVAGTVYERQIVLEGGTIDIPDLYLSPGTVDNDGFFNSEVDVFLDGSRQTVGEYGGVIGGVDSDALAGGLYVVDHISNDIDDEEEYGTFVLGRCGGPLEDASTECSVVDPE